LQNSEWPTHHQSYYPPKNGSTTTTSDAQVMEATTTTTTPTTTTNGPKAVQQGKLYNPPATSNHSHKDSGAGKGLTCFTGMYSPGGWKICPKTLASNEHTRFHLWMSIVLGGMR